MPTVRFIPLDSSIEVEAGASLLDAITAAGGEIEASCGGEGGCGQCRVQVTSGTVEYVTRACLSPQEREQGWVLACSSRVTEDVTVRLPAEGEEKALVVSDELRLQTPPEKPAEPVATKYVLEVEPPSLDNSFGDLERVERTIESIAGPTRLRCSLDTLRSLAATLRAQDHRVTVTLADGDGEGARELIKIESGDTTERAFGLAIDVGTTTCAAHLVDLATNHIAAAGNEYNGQIKRGLDIISRINYARDPARRVELRQLVLDTLNRLIDGLCEEKRVCADEIDNVSIAGNTTMIHLLLGLDPEHIRLEPYTPTVNVYPPLRGREVGLHVHPRACVGFAPGVGSYVGGDITAGLLQTALATDDAEVRLFLDIGTNGEVVVGNGEWLMACAASAGPAFEGRGVGCGMRAVKGAVERVRIDPDSGQAQISVIGGGKPKGICGSGVVDLLSELWTRGLLDSSGKLDPSRRVGLIREDSDSARTLVYTVVAASESATGREIVLTEHDIQNILRTKAAVYAACSFMLKSVGLDFSAIRQVYVAGGFGRFLDIEKSIMIGLLPDLPVGSFTYLGNSALAGAHRMLTSKAAREKAIELARCLTYLELNVDPSYMDEYTAALFLPHTDMDRFPSVWAKRA